MLVKAHKCLAIKVFRTSPHSIRIPDVEMVNLIDPCPSIDPHHVKLCMLNGIIHRYVKVSWNTSFKMSTRLDQYRTVHSYI